MSTQQLRAKLQRVRLLVSDVDGTLTNGALYYGTAGTLWRRFHVHDGLGIQMLQRAGILVAFVSQEQLDIEARARKLGVHHCLSAVRAKDRAVLELVHKNGISLEEVAYIGDDLTDLAAIRIAGVSAAPADAVPEVRRLVDYVCTRPGGYGAVREFCSLILEAQGYLLEELVKQVVEQSLPEP